jgi:hypothetical protein
MVKCPKCQQAVRAATEDYTVQLVHTDQPTESETSGRAVGQMGQPSDGPSVVWPGPVRWAVGATSQSGRRLVDEAGAISRTSPAIRPAQPELAHGPTL